MGAARLSGVSACVTEHALAALCLPLAASSRSRSATKLNSRAPPLWPLFWALRFGAAPVGGRVVEGRCWAL
eukprot:7637374-Alexandrium_andersonii.AAC.1